MTTLSSVPKVAIVERSNCIYTGHWLRNSSLNVFLGIHYVTSRAEVSLLQGSSHYEVVPVAFQLRDLQAMQTTLLTLKAMQERIETSACKVP